jgi:hypothetical protein
MPRGAICAARRSSSGGADFLASLQAAIYRVESIRRPVGACWVCQSPGAIVSRAGRVS